MKVGHYNSFSHHTIAVPTGAIILKYIDKEHLNFTRALKYYKVISGEAGLGWMLG